ncbi:Uncharacterised protein [Vibrio cholerae]|nr:Uncharacterised protein [Vibrio cholerae]
MKLRCCGSALKPIISCAILINRSRGTAPIYYAMKTVANLWFYSAKKPLAAERKFLSTPRIRLLYLRLWLPSSTDVI